MADQYCPYCGLPLGLRRHGRQCDCICIYALQVRVTALEKAGEALRTACGPNALTQAEGEWDELVTEKNEEKA